MSPRGDCFFFLTSPAVGTEGERLRNVCSTCDAFLQNPSERQSENTVPLVVTRGAKDMQDRSRLQQNKYPVSY